jgi:hypothetical protein
MSTVLLQSALGFELYNGWQVSGVVEIGVVASRAHGSSNGADEPCFARGFNFSNTLSDIASTLCHISTGLVPNLSGT